MINIKSVLETLSSSAWLQLLLGLCFVVILPSILLWGPEYVSALNTHLTTLVTVTLAFSAALFLYRRVFRYEFSGAIAYIFPVVTVVFFVAAASFLFGRNVYSNSLLLTSYVFALIWFYGGYFIDKRIRVRRYLVVPVGRSFDIITSANIKLAQISSPNSEDFTCDGVIADLHSPQLTSDWERFLAKCVLKRIPVMHVGHAYEAFTGRIPVLHLSENDMGSLIPSPIYSMAKRVMDVVAVLCSLPIVLPVSLIVALVIKIDTVGPVLFLQNRVGQANRSFKIIKFRSMIFNAEAEGARLATANDQRITRAGRFIRKTRLDELPQLWNVLNGDMSLIGPRPEQRHFVDQFEKEVPFYTYRHVVKPGITGWAQIMQGYADDTASTKLKVQYDFYYIKHFSLWLDILIFIKTIRVIFSGFGAR